jgi:hypothetical protein
MAENLFLKLEEKMMILISELEQLRKENQRLNQENSFLKNEREGSMAKLSDLILLIDTINPVENAVPSLAIAAVKPVLVQG